MAQKIELVIRLFSGSVEFMPRESILPKRLIGRLDCNSNTLQGSNFVKRKNQKKFKAICDGNQILVPVDISRDLTQETVDIFRHRF